jgi:hypothetical protein
LTRHLEVEAGWRGVAERGEVAWPGSTGARWKMELTGGARLAVTEGESIIAGLRKLKEEMSFGKYAKAAQAGMGRARTCGLWEKRGGRWGWPGCEAGWADWLLGRLGRK